MSGARVYSPSPIYRHTDPVSGLIVAISAREIDDARKASKR